MWGYKSNIESVPMGILYYIKCTEIASCRQSIKMSGIARASVNPDKGK